jgi:hypothetical protein
VRFVEELPYIGGEGAGRNALVTEAAVHRRGVMEDMAATAVLLGNPHGRGFVACIAPEPHGQMRIMEEGPGRKG